MSNYYEKNFQVVLGSLTVSGANTVSYRPARPTNIQKIILLTTTAQTGTDNVLTVGVRNIDGTGSVSKGTAAVPTAGSAINQVRFINVVKPKPAGSGTVQTDGSIYYAGYAPGGPIHLKPGQELYVTSNGASTAGVYDVRAEALDEGFTGPDVTGIAVEMVFTGI